MLKRRSILVVALAAMMSLSMVGCDLAGGENSLLSGSSETLSVTDNNVIDNCCEIKLVEGEIVDKIESTKLLTVGYTIDASTGNLFVKLGFEIKNTQAEDLIFNDSVSADIFIDDIPYECAFINDSHTLENAYRIKPGETGKICCATEVPEEKISNDIKLKMKVNKKTYEAEINIDQAKRTINLGETFTNDDKCDVKIDSVEFKDILEPYAPQDYYTYYEARNKDENKLLVVGTTVTNKQDSNLSSSSITTVKAVYNMEHCYSSAILEKADGSDLLEGTSATIAPGESRKVYYVAEVPKDAQVSDIDLSVEINNVKHFIKSE